MSESLEGVSVAVTRQKAGRVENCEAAAGRPAVGDLKAPAITLLADVIVVSGSLSEASPSHEAAKTGEVMWQDTVSVTSSKILLPATVAPPLLSNIATPLQGTVVSTESSCDTMLRVLQCQASDALPG